ncbi:MAG: hypothetical protein MRY83_11415 [Flavobacteriales bacterium]|nr:hypothetical protein [Flavobacteriales bacterium]
MGLKVKTLQPTKPNVLKRKSALAVPLIILTGFTSTPNLKPTSRGTASWILSLKKGSINSGWSRSPASSFSPPSRKPK